MSSCSQLFRVPDIQVQSLGGAAAAAVPAALPGSWQGRWKGLFFPTLRASPTPHTHTHSGCLRRTGQGRPQPAADNRVPKKTGVGKGSWSLVGQRIRAATGPAKARQCSLLPLGLLGTRGEATSFLCPGAWGESSCLEHQLLPFPLPSPEERETHQLFSLPEVRVQIWQPNATCPGLALFSWHGEALGGY